MIGLGLLNKAIRIPHAEGTIEDLVLHYTFDNTVGARTYPISDPEDISMTMDVKAVTRSTGREDLSMNMDVTAVTRSTGREDITMTMDILSVTII